MPRGGAVAGSMIRSGITLPSLPAIVTVRARLENTGAGKAPSPRLRAARACSAPTIHHSGVPSSSAIIRALRSAVSGSIAASANSAGSNGLVSVIVSSRRDAHRQRPDAVDEVGIGPLRRPHHLDHRVPRHDLFPQDAQLQFGESVADAAVDAEAERQMLARPRP